MFFNLQGSVNSTADPPLNQDPENASFFGMDKCGLSNNPTWPWEEILHFGNFQQSIDIQFVRAERDSTYTQETAQNIVV